MSIVDTATGTNGVPVPSMVYNDSGTQVISFSGTAAQSTEFTEKTSVYMVADDDIHLKVGSDPTAVAGTDRILPANTIHHETIRAGHKLSIVKKTGASDGKVYVTPVVNIAGYR